MQGSQVVWPAKAVAAVEPLPVPTPKDNEALVRTRVTLISQGTERAWFLGLPGTVFPFPGPAYGYSNVGEVIALGAQVSGLRVGQRVASGAGHLSHFAMDAA